MISALDATREHSANVEELWRTFSAPLRTFLRSRTRNAADADDLLQEVFTRIHRSLTTLHDTSKLQGWIYRIARNALTDYYRTHQKTRAQEDPFDLDDPWAHDAVDLTPSLRRFVAALPPLYRVPLLKHEFQGEPLQSVAETLGLSLTATKSRVQRARRMLREMLDQCCTFEFDRRGKVISATPRKTCLCDESC